MHFIEWEVGEKKTKNKKQKKKEKKVFAEELSVRNWWTGAGGDSVGYLGRLFFFFFWLRQKGQEKL